MYKKVGIGFRGDAEAILIDARPAVKYEKQFLLV